MKNYSESNNDPENDGIPETAPERGESCPPKRGHDAHISRDARREGNSTTAVPVDLVADAEPPVGDRGKHLSMRDDGPRELHRPRRPAARVARFLAFPSIGYADRVRVATIRAGTPQEFAEPIRRGRSEIRIPSYELLEATDLYSHADASAQWSQIALNHREPMEAALSAMERAGARAMRFPVILDVDPDSPPHAFGMIVHTDLLEELRQGELETVFITVPPAASKFGQYRTALQFFAGSVGAGAAVLTIADHAREVGLFFSRVWASFSNLFT